MIFDKDYFSRHFDILSRGGVTHDEFISNFSNDLKNAVEKKDSIDLMNAANNLNNLEFIQESKISRIIPFDFRNNSSTSCYGNSIKKESLSDHAKIFGAILCKCDEKIAFSFLNNLSHALSFLDNEGLLKNSNKLVHGIVPHVFSFSKSISLLNKCIDFYGSSIINTRTFNYESIDRKHQNFKKLTDYAISYFNTDSLFCIYERLGKNQKQSAIKNITYFINNQKFRDALAGGITSNDEELKNKSINLLRWFNNIDPFANGPILCANVLTDILKNQHSVAIKREIIQLFLTEISPKLDQWVNQQDRLKFHQDHESRLFQFMERLIVSYDLSTLMRLPVAIKHCLDSQYESDGHSAVERYTKASSSALAKELLMNDHILKDEVTLQDFQSMLSLLHSDSSKPGANLDFFDMNNISDCLQSYKEKILPFIFVAYDKGFLDIEKKTFGEESLMDIITPEMKEHWFDLERSKNASDSVKNILGELGFGLDSFRLRN